MRKLLQWGLTLCCCLGWLPLAAAQELVAEVDRQQVSIDETLTLKVRFIGGQAGNNFDMRALDEHFDVLGSQKSMQHSIVNGQVEAFTQWTYTLAPKKTGTALIPEFDLDGYKSQPIEIGVKPPAPAPKGAREDVFVETVVDKTEIFVQEQLLVTYRLYMNRNVDNLDRPDLTLPGARVEELPRVEYRRTLDGVPYDVVEFKFAVFPDSSGELTIPGELWTVRTQDGAPVNRFALGGGRFKLYRIRTDELKVTVAPKPDDYPANATWLPAKSLTLAESWSKAPDEFNFGEPITRTITVTAEGLSSEQLPPLPTPPGDGDFKFYPDQPTLDNRVQASGVTGVRVESSAIVPSRGGELVLPEVTLQWWDVNTNSLSEASLPERVITVAGPVTPVPAPVDAPAALAPVASETPAAAATPGLWPWLTLAAVGVAVLFAILWWRARQERPPAATSPVVAPPRPRAVLREVTAAAKARDLHALRRALLAWAVAAQLPARTLAQLAELAPSDLAEALSRLDAALYGNADAGSVPVDLISKRISELDRDAPSTATALPPLYAS